ncbi:MAG: 50S ribosomal protein L31 [bacterium]|nr:50S ribosomal protein L31 [bacterium]
MKSNIHPNWYPEATITCACGNKMTVGATVNELTVDVCSNCHPFYTGQMKYLDAAGRVESFKSKQKGATKISVSKTEKRRIKKLKKIEKDRDLPESLAELRKPTKKEKK